MNLKAFAAVIFLGWAVLGCSGEEKEAKPLPPPPPNLVPTSKLVDVVADLFILDAAINNYAMDQNALVKHKKELQDTIFFTHGISKVDFDSTMNYYLNHLDTLNVVYQQVTVKLNKLHSKAQE